MLTIKKTSLHVTVTMVLFLTSEKIKAQNATDSLQNELSIIKEDIIKIKNLKITGWVQSQWQHAESRGAENFDGGNFPSNSNNRFMIRRGRVKFTYAPKNSMFVLQLNGTERGVNVTDLYGKITEPWLNSISLTAGIQNRPFGYEIDQSSVDRETPERSRYIQILLPNERDMGMMLTFLPVKESKLHGLKVDAGFFNGTGIIVPGTTGGNQSSYRQGQTFISGVTDFDYIKDFIGRACYGKTFKDEKIKLGIGSSYYNGGFIYQNNKVYNTIRRNIGGELAWVMADTTSKTYTGAIAPRKYYGTELQFTVNTFLGTTNLRGEYAFGIQSGQINDTRSPAFLPELPDTYVRKFNAGNAYFIQRLGKSKHEIVVKYEWYDPNTEVKGSDITNTNFTKADIKYTMLGLGYLLYWDANVKFMFYYNIVKNEKTNLNGFTFDVPDNIFTARVQYRF